jgi:hypothetical protein
MSTYITTLEPKYEEKRQICDPSWGRCYDLNFLRFSTIFGKKLAFFSKINVMIKILHNLALFWVKNVNFFAKFFGENILKIITSVPGWNMNRDFHGFNPFADLARTSPHSCHIPANTRIFKSSQWVGPKTIKLYIAIPCHELEVDRASAQAWLFSFI